VGFPVDWSVKVTDNAAHPEVTFAVKFGTGFWPNAKAVQKTMKMSEIIVFFKGVLFGCARRLN
jgi:hypothetical protein